MDVVQGFYISMGDKRAMTDVDCMTCLVNMARGLEVDGQVLWNGVRHATVYEMGPGRVRAACRYIQVRVHDLTGWRVRL